MRTSRLLILGAGVILLALVAGGQMAARPALAVPANDNFANAIAITSMVTDPVVAVTDTPGATTEAGEPSPCGGIASTVWYSWTIPAGDGHITLDTFGSNYDTVLAVYRGNSVNALTLVSPSGCNDDFASLQSAVWFDYDNLGTSTYWIQVGGFGGATGNLVINLSRGATMVVTASNDNIASDFGLSLREAIGVATDPNAGVCPLTANEQAFTLGCGTSGTQWADLIHFSSTFFPPGAPTTIALGSSLPPLNNSGDVISGIGAGVIIDGQNGQLASGCISITGNTNMIQGLDLRRCSVAGVSINGGYGNLVGIDISNPTPLAAERNIMRESTNGIKIANTGAGNAVWGNYIGTDETGADSLGNGNGVKVEFSAYQQIGYFGARRNVISGNTNGVYLASSFGTGITGNLIGTNPAGTAALGNGYGILVQDSTSSPIRGNVISGNGLEGIHVLAVSPGFTLAGGNVITGNYIGTNATGTAGIPNLGGITIQNADRNTIGGPDPAQRNIISGNNGSGVQLFGAYSTRNEVLGNYIGVDVSGAADLPNAGSGVEAFNNATSNTVGGAVPGARNVISGNGAGGVAITGAGGGTSYYPSFDVPQSILDFTTAVSTIEVPETATVTDVNVRLDITHTWVGDLTITLVNPDGLDVQLAVRVGGSGDNYAGTVFDDDPGGYLPISAGSAPFSGIWYPDTPLSQFDGSLAKGTWSLLVNDAAGGDVGTLNWWSLEFTTNGNEVAGNYIGTNAAGTQALGNSTGVLVSDSPSNTIGGSLAGARNVISGNTNQGVQIIGGPATGNLVSGNYIGTDATGSVDLGNGTDGVDIDGAAYNCVCASISGSIGEATADRNIISGNNNNGVLISGAGAVGNLVGGNYIGTNAAGTADLGNTLHGVLVEGAGVNTIGVAFGGGNLISGNNQDGIRVLAATTGSLIQANFIGTDATGTQGIANASKGIFILGGSSNTIVGGPTVVERNVISGNVSHGINIQQPGTSSNIIHGNYIGTKVDGVSPLGNGAGIGISGGASNNRIGGTSPGEGNTIAHNATRGIGLLSSGFDPIDNRWYRNSIFGNGGLGIDLNQDGVTANDAGDGDSGPNALQNFPELQYASYAASFVSIVGSLNTTPNGAYIVAFFISPDCDPSGHGEGASFFGQTTVGTDGTGQGPFVAAFPSAPVTGFITAVAIDDDATFNTSEFSKCVAVGTALDDDGDGYTTSAEAGAPLCDDALNADVGDDALINDGCPASLAPESVGQCANSTDDDGDLTVNDGCPKVGAYSEAQFNIGTGALDSCGNNGWPSDLDDQPLSANELDIFDISSYIAPVRLLDKSPGPGSPYNARWDLSPGPAPFTSFINIVDITTMLSGAAGSPAYPPMFGGLRAFGRLCPFAP